MHLKVERGKIYIWAIVILSVFPQYFQLANHNITSMIMPIVFIFYLIFHSRFRFKIDREEFPIWLWVVARNISYFANGEFFTAIAFDVIMIAFKEIIVNFSSSEDRFLKIFDAMIGVSVILGILGIVEGLTSYNPFFLLNNTGETINTNVPRFGIYRILSFTTQASHYAIYCSIMILLTLYRMQYNKLKRAKSRYLLALFLQCINLFFTGSRSALLAFAVILILLALHRGVKKFVSYALIALLVIILFIFAFNQTYIGQVLISFLSKLVPSLSSLLDATTLNSAEYLNPLGNRLDLYAWVFEKMPGHWALGYGEKTKFAYDYRVTAGAASWIQTKESIEVNYLYLIFHYGFLGMITEVFMMVYCTVKSYKLTKKNANIQGKFSFNYYTFLIVLVTLITWFGVMQGEEKYTIYIVLFLWISNNRLFNKANPKGLELKA